MTTGSYSGYANCNSEVSQRANASWSGSDGKYEVSAGRKRTKWNAFTKTYRVKTAKFGPTPGVCIDWTPVHTLWTANASNALLAKLSSKAKSHDFNMGVAVAEGRQTISLVKKALLDIGQGIVDLKHGRLGRVSNLIRGSRRKPSTKDVADRWIELQYGWLPLFSDVYEAGKAFESLTSSPRAQVIRVSKRVKDFWTYGSSPSNYVGAGPRVTKGTIWYERQEALSAARSLGLINPASILWELTPWSFVIDWFTPIGTYLENLSIIPNLHGRFMQTIVTEWNPTYVAVKPAYAGNTVQYYCRKVDRTVPTSLSVPLPGFKRWPQALSPGHVYNAIALARQKAGTGPLAL